MDAEMTNLPEYEANPFTRVLGPPITREGYFDILDAPAAYDESERRAPAHLRRHCVMRLFDLCIPTARQVELAERMGMIVRQGYKGRDPSKGHHKAAFLATAALIERHRNGEDVSGERLALVHSDAQSPGFVAIGDPGMGKTRGMDRILMHMEQVHAQQLGYHVCQLVYVKVQCPSDGSRGAFCQAVFTAFDRALGTDYLTQFGRSKTTVGAMILGVQHVCTLHALGVLAMDEIQHLDNAKEGPEMLMNFLVTLVNSIGVPVVLIGTNKARKIVQRDFREARRASGLPTGAWERMKREDKEFDRFVTELWSYQWTNVPTELTDEIRDVIYDESQGIIDLIVKLFMLAQLRIISIAEQRGDPAFEEHITCELLRRVAKDELGLVAPMVRALRDGRTDVLESYPDLEPFDLHVDAIFAKALGQTMDEFLHLRDLASRAAERARKDGVDEFGSFRDSMAARGIAPRRADELIAAAIERVPTRDPLELALVLRDLLVAEAGAVPMKRKKRRGGAGGSKAAGKDVPADSLRAVAGCADPHAELVARGIVAQPNKREAA